MSQPVDTDRNLLVKTPFANVVGWLVIIFCLFLGVSWLTLGGKSSRATLLLGSQLEERGIEVRRTKRAMYLLSKNAKVR